MTKYEKHSHWIYAVYKGDEFITEGTREEICEKLQIKKRTFYFYRYKAYQRRGKPGSNRKIIIRIDNL